MSQWSFVESVTGAPNAPEGESVTRYRMQALSDIYRSVQPRLDSYRQSAAAIFIGVSAAILAFDSGIIRVMMDPVILQPTSYYPAVVIGVCGVLLLLIGLGGCYTIRLIGKYFAEMTAIVYRIDMVNQVWIPGAWIIPEGAEKPESLFPLSFRSAAKVGVSGQDQDLRGWFDPAISLFANITLFLGIVHFAAFGMLSAHGMSLASAHCCVPGAIKTAAPAAVGTPSLAPSAPLSSPKK